MNVCKKIFYVISTIVTVLLITTGLISCGSDSSTDDLSLGENISKINFKQIIVKEMDSQLSSKLNDYVLTMEEKDGNTETIKGKDIELTYLLDEDSKNIDNITNPFYWCFSVLDPTNESGVAITYNEDLLNQQINNLSCLDSSNVIEPQNPSIILKDNKYVIVDEVEGNKVNRETLYNNIRSALSTAESKISLMELNCYEKPSYTSDSEAVVNACKNLNIYKNANITYKIGNNTETLDSSTINSWLGVDEDYNITFNNNGGIYGFVNGLANKYNTAYKAKEFKTSTGNVISISDGPYGWKVNIDGEVSSLIEAIKEGKSKTKELTFSQSAATHDGNNIGNSYVEIDLGNQHLYLYIDGALIMETNIVSGNVSKGYTTPAGVYGLYYKQTDQILRGEDYATPVSFWMPFNGGIGLHDASWRTPEELANKETYLTSGSHGCINMSYESAQTLYQNVWANIPVVCYY